MNNEQNRHNIIIK